MLYNLIFYGTLKNLNLLQKTIEMSPVKIRYGFIKGTLFEVNDVFEPNGITKYPIATSDGNNFILSLMVSYNLKEKEFKSLLKKIIIFEGYLYKYKKLMFLDFHGIKEKGFAFIAKNKNIIKNDLRISPIKPFGKIYLW
jgi:hypothetical protein